MVGTSPCPGREDWQRFLLGQLAEGETATLEQHLSGCGNCLGTVQALRPRDAFVETVRVGGKAGGAPTDEADPALIERLCRMGGQSRGEETPSGEGAADTPPPPRPGSPAREETGEPYDFLAPPRGPGEVGRLGHYRVVNVLGAGGMGVVFQAEDEQLRRLVALKVMRPTQAGGAAARQRFLREARAMAAVKHDHVVTIHHVGEDRDVPFLAMELLEGETLEERLRRQGRLPVLEVVRVGREAAEGLAAAHAHGLIHRDVKPSNIWLERAAGRAPELQSGGLPRVKLLDFGLARPVGGDVNLTGSGIIVGTPAYMAPEQARGAEVDARCDLFGVGCVLYRMATGVVPFQRPDTLATLLALANDSPRPLRALNAEAPAALERVVTRLLAKRPEERYASAREAAAALQAIEADLGRPAQPVVRRRRFIFAILLLALLGPLAYLFGPTVVRVATNKGELVIESDDRDVTVTVTPAGQGQKETVTIAARGQRSLTLTAGDYELEVQEADGLHFTTAKPVTLTRGGREVVRVALVLAQARTPARAEAQPAAEAARVEATLGDGRLRHWNWVNAVTVGPDGRWLASASSDATAGVWDAVTGDARYTLVGHSGEVLCVAFHPGRKLLATGGLDGTVRLWDAATGRAARTLTAGGGVHTVAFSPDGGMVAAMTPKALRLWDTGTGEERHTITLDTEQMERVTDGFAFRPGGTVLAFRAGNGVKVWDFAAGKERQTFHGPGKPVSCVAYAPDGKTLAVGTTQPEAVVLLLDAETGQERQRFTGGEPKEDVKALAFGRDGQALAAAFLGRVRQWDLAIGTEGPTLMEDKPNSFTDVVFSQDGRTVFGGSTDPLVRAWDAVTGKERPVPEGAAGFRSGMALSPDGDTVACASYDHTVKLFDLTTKEVCRTFQGHTGPLYAVAYSPDGKRLASTGADNTVRVWDLITGKECFYRNPVGDRLAFSPDGRALASFWWGRERPCRLRDALTGEEGPPLEAVRGDGSARGAFSPDGATVAAGFRDHPVVFWDVATGKKKGQLEPQPGEAPPHVYAVAYGPDGKTMAVSDRAPDGACRTRLWDLTTGRPLRVLLGCDSLVSAVAFSRDGRTLATAGYSDGSVRLWDPASGRPLRTFVVGPPLGHVGDLAFSPDGRQLLTLNGNRTVFVLRLISPPGP
jgi:WD40 repeat protein/serine/threonine protein kinase